MVLGLTQHLQLCHLDGLLLVHLHRHPFGIQRLCRAHLLPLRLPRRPLPLPLIMATSTSLELVFTVLVFGFAGKSLPKIITFVVFFGVSGGGFSSFLTPVSRDIPDNAGSNEFSLRFLYLVFVRGLAAMLGPILAVQFYPDRLSGATGYGSFGFTGFIAFIAATLALSTLSSLAIIGYKKWVVPKMTRQKLRSNPATPAEVQGQTQI